MHLSQGKVIIALFRNYRTGPRPEKWILVAWATEVEVMSLCFIVSRIEDAIFFRDIDVLESSA